MLYLFCGYNSNISHCKCAIASGAPGWGKKFWSPKHAKGQNNRSKCSFVHCFGCPVTPTPFPLPRSIYDRQSILRIYPKFPLKAPLIVPKEHNWNELSDIALFFRFFSFEVSGTFVYSPTLFTGMWNPYRMLCYKTVDFPLLDVSFL